MRVAPLIQVCLLLGFPGLVRAQVSGVVIDQIAQRRVPGAVVTTLDSARRVIARGLADDSGRFRIMDAGGARRLRVAKIGYRPVEIALASTASVQIPLERLPNMLEPVLTSDQPRCSRNSTRPAAFGLWEQARAALLGSVLARETNSAEVRRINYRRYLAQKGDEIERQSVRRDSGMAMRSFDATFPAAEFMKRGFAEAQPPNAIRFYGPDAEVLLDDVFVEGYCLELASPRRDRPTEAGLRFQPMTRQRGRVDLDGTLWIDTSARVLREIEYRYLGLESWGNAGRPGGTISFRDMSPAIVWIDQWMIRMTGASIDTGGRSLPAYLRRLSVTEGGAELASARWPDGHSWSASLGTAWVRLTTPNGIPLAGARMRLDSTDYGGVTDSAGRITITELLPGPYTISVYDSTLAVIDTALPASVGFKAGRDSVSNVTAAIPTLTDFISAECRAQDSFDGKSAFFVARILSEDSVPMAGARWQLEPPAGHPDVLNAPMGYYAHGRTGPEGMVHVCTRLTRGKRVVLRVWRPERVATGKEIEAGVALTERVTTLKVVFKP